MGRRKKMQIRTITVDYARPRGYDVGYRAENNFTLLALPIPAELEGADSYRVYFESTVGEYLQTELLTPTDGYVTVKITSDIVPEPGNMAAQLVAFKAGEIVGYAPMITGTAKVSIPDGTERLSHSLAAEIALNTAARHSHENKGTLDKLSDSNGKLQYNGQALDGDGGTLIIKCETTAIDENRYHITAIEPPDKDILEAYNAGKQLVIKAHVGDNYSWLPLISYTNDGMLFGAFINGYTVFASLAEAYIGLQMIIAEEIEYAYSSTNDVDWLFDSGNVRGTLDDIITEVDTLDDVSFSLQDDVDKLTKQSHTHDNKAVLDLLSVTDGKLKYNGSDVGLKGDKGDPGAKGDPGSDANVTKANVVTALGYTPKAVSAQVATGSNITLADNTEYRLTDVTTLTLNYLAGDFECWMRLTFAASGNITVTLPADTKYIGTAPDFKNGETWELSFKDKVLAAQKVGEGT